MFVVIRCRRNPWDTYVKGPYDTWAEARDWIVEHHKTEGEGFDGTALQEQENDFYPYDGDDGGYIIQELKSK